MDRIQNEEIRLGAGEAVMRTMKTVEIWMYNENARAQTDKRKIWMK
jgi:hypothetical protein